jgi:DNA-binding response OmpR family regulator
LTGVRGEARTVDMSDLLLVDDDRRIVDLVAFFLRRRGHVVRTCDAFGAVRAAIAERAPDLVLCDVDLGGERADEELPRLASEGILPRTLIVSGYVDAEIEARLMSIEGVVGIVRKPFDFAMLEARIEEALAASKRASAIDESAGDLGDEDGWVEVRSFEADA